MIIDTAAGPATINVRIEARDDLSGFGSGSTGSGSIDIRHSSGASPFGRGSLPITGGTTLNPIFEFTLTAAQFSLPGIYPINLTLVDNVFNTSRFTPADLAALGFPSQIEITAQIELPVDIKPRSCPNPLNARSKGDLPVAFIGTAALDGTTIDAASVRLLDVAPFRSSLEDVATPFQPFIGKSVASDCTDQGSDGLTDLILKFDKQEVLQAIETALGRQVRDREVLVLTLTGNLKDGTPILGEDVVLILNKGRS